MKSVFITLSLILALGCGQKSEIQRLQAENAQLHSQMSSLQFQLSQATGKLQEAKTQLARKPAMPVQVNFRKAVMGSGCVVVISTTVKQDFPVIVEFKSKSLGTIKRFQVNLSQERPSEIGHLEGATIFPGDQVTIQNNQYESVSATCPSF